jgi:hypothetical protein
MKSYFGLDSKEHLPFIWGALAMVVAFALTRSGYIAFLIGLVIFIYTYNSAKKQEESPA